MNSPHAAGTFNFLEKIAEEADNENIEDDLITNDDDTKSEGECPVHFNSQRPVFSGGLTVSQTIPQKIKVKIWKHNSDRATIRFIEAHMPVFTRLTSCTSVVSHVIYF